MNVQGFVVGLVAIHCHLPIVPSAALAFSGICTILEIVVKYRDGRHVGSCVIDGIVISVYNMIVWVASSFLGHYVMAVVAV